MIITLALTIGLLLYALACLILYKRNSRLQRQLQQQAEELRQLDEQVKSAELGTQKFFESLNYELRIPLNSILGAASLARTEKNDIEKSSHLAAITQAATELSIFFEEVFEKAAQQEDGFCLSPVKFSLRNQLQSWFRESAARARKVGVSCSLDIKKEVPDAYRADYTRMLQGLTGLHNQLLSFAKAGSHIELQVQGRTQSDSNYVLECTMVGTALNHTVEQLEALYATEQCFQINPHTRFGFGFRPFTLALENFAKFSAEVGILTPSKTSIEFATHLSLLRDVSAESSGQTPVLAIHNDKNENAPLGLSVLLVEDDKLNRLIAQHLLEQIGCTVLLAETGERALEIYQSENCDAILMDRDLPGIDGLQLTALIKRLQEKTDCKAPIIALTAHVSTREKKRCLEAGMHSFLSKPLTPDALHSALATVSPQQTGKQGSKGNHRVFIEPSNKTIC